MKALIVIIAAALIVLFVVPLQKSTIIQPIDARDSDGKSFLDITNSTDYFVLLKTSPFGYTEIDWNYSGSEDVFIITDWNAYDGAGNIYIGYFDGEWKEIGPLGGGSYENEIYVPNYIRDIKFRFRGEDTDLGVEAVAHIKTSLVERKNVNGLVGLL